MKFRVVEIKTTIKLIKDRSHQMGYTSKESLLRIGVKRYYPFDPLLVYDIDAIVNWAKFLKITDEELMTSLALDISASVQSRYAQLKNDNWKEN